MAYALDLKSNGPQDRVGSSPTSPTILRSNGANLCSKLRMVNHDDIGFTRRSVLFYLASY